jgi:hypothetical protein
MFIGTEEGVAAFVTEEGAGSTRQQMICLEFMVMFDLMSVGLKVEEEPLEMVEVGNWAIHCRLSLLMDFSS